MIPGDRSYGRVKIPKECVHQGYSHFAGKLTQFWLPYWKCKFTESKWYNISVISTDC